MATPSVTMETLRSEVEDFKSRFPKLKDDELFVLWFLNASFEEDEVIAAKALTGVSNDKGVDAVLIDEGARVVFVVQGKFRQALGVKREGRADIVSFADLGGLLWGDKERFTEFCQDLDPLVRGKLEEARDRLVKRKYKLALYYVSTGSCSSKLRTEAGHIVKQANGPTDVVILDHRQVIGFLRDYLDGVAPPVKSLDLRVESGGKGKATGVVSRYDPELRIDSLVFSMSGADVGDLFSQAGTRLFARNIRGFLGDTKINRAMEETLTTRPHFFWYYNNGVTVICDNATKISERGREILRVENPQVINGQQTTRVLQANEKLATKASVLVRVISVPREGDGSNSHFDELVSRIVEATNWQNAIKASDLVANDRQQVLIERELRKVGYQYLRKRQTKGEARRAASSQYRFQIKKEELARATAACRLDPVVVREGVEGLFEERYYATIFDNADPNYYLPRYWLMRRVELVARGYPERAYAKWVVLHFIWEMAGREIGRHPVRFREACERKDAKENWRIMGNLDKAINIAFVTALEFYRKTRPGKGAKAQDVSTFFQKRELDKQFRAFWNTEGIRHHSSLDKSFERFMKALKE